MGSLSPWHWAIVILAFIILFGYKRLPDAARGLGRSLRIFKTEIQDLRDDPKDTSATAGSTGTQQSVAIDPAPQAGTTGPTTNGSAVTSDAERRSA